MKYLVLLFCVVYMSVGCTLPHSQQKKGIKITDYYDREVTITEAPKRIVSASPEITEILYALGEEKRLIGRSDYCAYPSQVSAIPSIGGIINPNLETIAYLNPELVIASTHFLKDVAETIQKMGIPVVVLKSPESFEGVYNLIQQTAEIVGAKAAADSIILRMKQDVNEVKAKVKLTHTKPKVYYVIGFGKTGNFTAGGNTLISSMINIAGGINIAENINDWSYSLENLIQENPDIIVIPNGSKELFMNTPSFKELNAVKNNKVFEVDKLLFELSGPRLSEGLKTLFVILHPEAK